MKSIEFEKLKSAFAQFKNYNLDMELNQETNTIKGVQEYNVSFYDRSGRHPWITLEFVLDLDTQTCEFEGEINSKYNDVCEAVDRDEVDLSEAVDYEDLVETIDQVFDDMARELEGVSM